MRSIRRPDSSWVALGVVLAATFLCFGGPRMGSLGFYHDDWAFLWVLDSAPGGFWGRMAALASHHSSLLLRPLEIPLYTAIFALSGTEPLAWQALLLLATAAAAWGAFGLLCRFGVGRGPALLGALMFLAYPNKDGAMYWPCLLVGPLALAAWLAAYRLHLDFVETGRGRSLGLSLACLGASLMVYDNCIALLPVWLITPALADRGVPTRARAGCAAAAAVLALVLVYKFVIAPRFIGVGFNKPMALSAAHFLSVYRLGIESSLGPALAKIAWDFFALSLEAVPFLAVSALILPWTALAWGTSESPAPAWRPLLALGAALFLLGYLPFTISDYVPRATTHMNRVNLVPAMGLALAAVALAAGPLRPLRRVLPALVGVGLAAHVGFALAWAESYRLQLGVRDAIVRGLDRWPADARLLLLTPRFFVDNKAPIFLAHWDISGAARIWTRDPSRQADVITPQTDFRPEGVRHRGETLAYEKVRVLDVARGVLLSDLKPSDFSRSP